MDFCGGRGRRAETTRRRKAKKTRPPTRLHLEETTVTENGEDAKDNKHHQPITRFGQFLSYHDPTGLSPAYGFLLHPQNIDQP